MSPAEWQAVRLAVFKKHGKSCAFCKKTPKSLDCHEIWSYSIEDGSSIGKQRLIKILPLCKACHMVCHIGFWSLQGKYEQALQHMARTRRISKAAASAEIAEAFQVFEHLSRFEWELEVGAVSSYINENK